VAQGFRGNGAIMVRMSSVISVPPWFVKSTDLRPSMS
jgi:hypothetical protein